MTEKKLSPIVSEFETEEEAEAYDAWFRKKVQRALDDPGRLISHDEAMAEVDEVIAEAAKRRAERNDQQMSKNKKLSPIVSEFETEKEAAAYDRWFRKRVQRALDDPRPSIPHEEVVSEIDQVIGKAATRARKKA